MSGSSERTVTGLLQEWRRGDSGALDRLIPLVYNELRVLARGQMRGERGGHTLQTTALVHEAYRRLVDVDLGWSDRVHFFAVAARVMRRVLVEHARAAGRKKRGGEQDKLVLQDGDASTAALAVEILDLDRALENLADLDERKSRAVELHYFGGMTYKEVAEAMEISEATLHRELRLARAWLQREMGAGGTTDGA